MDQVDVRKLPPHYAHRKVSEALSLRTRDLIREKERKFRTTLQNHALFAIVCDHKRFKGKEKNKNREEEDEVEQSSLDDTKLKAEKDPETFDWT